MHTRRAVLRGGAGGGGANYSIAPPPCDRAATPRRRRRGGAWGPPATGPLLALAACCAVLALAGSGDAGCASAAKRAEWRPRGPGADAAAAAHQPIAGRLRLRGGRVKTLADKLYAKKNKAAVEEKAYEQLLREEEEEIAEEYRGLPYEERLKLALGDGGSEDRQDADAEGGGADADGAAASAAPRTAPRAARKGAAHADTDRGEVQTLANVHVLRTGRTSGDAWAGLFFDLQATEASVEVLGISTASHFFRKEAHIAVSVFVCNGSSVDKEGDVTVWEPIFAAANISLPTVGKRDPDSNFNSTTSAYGLCVRALVRACVRSCVRAYSNFNSTTSAYGSARAQAGGHVCEQACVRVRTSELSTYLYIYVYMCVCVCMYVCVYAYIHICIYTPRHIHVYTYILIYKLAHKRTYNTHTHTHTHKYARTHTHARTHTCIYT